MYTQWNNQRSSFPTCQITIIWCPKISMLVQWLKLFIQLITSGAISKTFVNKATYEKLRQFNRTIPSYDDRFAHILTKVTVPGYAKAVQRDNGPNKPCRLCTTLTIPKAGMERKIKQCGTSIWQSVTTSNNTRTASLNKPLMMSKYLECRQRWGRHSHLREVFCYQGEREMVLLRGRRGRGEGKNGW